MNITDKFKKHIESVARRITSTDAPYKTAIREVHAKAERRIKDKLRNTTTRNPIATDPGSGSNVKQIEQSIHEVELKIVWVFIGIFSAEKLGITPNEWWKVITDRQVLNDILT